MLQNCCCDWCKSFTIYLKLRLFDSRLRRQQTTVLCAKGDCTSLIVLAVHVTNLSVRLVLYANVDFGHIISQDLQQQA